jgi:hypothetical protein
MRLAQRRLGFLRLLFSTDSAEAVLLTPQLVAALAGNVHVRELVTFLLAFPHA